ncbi:MAG: hypothetical protein SGBAC_005798 [Bacillariaceae sp.]
MTALRILLLICTLSSTLQLVASSSSSSSSTTTTTTTTTTTSSSSSSNPGASWQPASSDSRSIQEANTYAEFPPTVFSPTGRLHSVETIVEASKSNTNPRANLVLAMNCKDGINSIFHQLSPNLVAATAGNLVDGHVLRHIFHQVCQSLMQQSGGSVRGIQVQASLLARHLADQLQIPTQNQGQTEMLASFGLLAGGNNGDGESLWRLDPTGQFWKCQAAVIGCHANKAEAILYQRLQQDMKDDDICQSIQNMSTEDALTLLMDCLESSFPAPPPSSTGGNAAASHHNTIYWQAMVQYHPSTSKKSPRRMFQRGAFTPHAPAPASAISEASSKV